MRENRKEKRRGLAEWGVGGTAITVWTTSVANAARMLDPRLIGNEADDKDAESSGRRAFDSIAERDGEEEVAPMIWAGVLVWVSGGDCTVYKRYLSPMSSGYCVP